VRKRSGVHDGGTAIRRPLDRGEVQEIVAVAAVETDYLMAKALQVGRYLGSNVPALPGDKNPHGP